MKVNALVVAVMSLSLCMVSLVGGGCAAGGKGGGAADPQRGQKYFQVKCNSCHPNGGQGAGPTIIGKLPPGPLKKNNSGGRHNVPDAEYESLLAYITPIMQPAAAAAATAAVAPAAAAVAPAAAAVPVATPPAAAPAAGMKTCNCTCQCPVGTPPGQMQNCTCACACPPG